MRYTDLLPVSILITILAFSAALPAASFDCGKATARIDKLICSSETLSSLDETLTAEYKKALSRTGNADKIKGEQRAWMKGRNACADQACVEQAYRARIDALHSEKPPVQPGQAGEPKPYRPYAGQGDSAVGQNESGDQMYIVTVTILDRDNFRLFTNKGDFFWAPWMSAKRVDAMSAMAEGMKGQDARITYSKSLGKSDTVECVVEGIARDISLFRKKASP